MLITFFFRDLKESNYLREVKCPQIRCKIKTSFTYARIIYFAKKFFYVDDVHKGRILLYGPTEKEPSKKVRCPVVDDDLVFFD